MFQSQKRGSIATAKYLSEECIGGVNFGKALQGSRYINNEDRY